MNTKILLYNSIEETLEVEIDYEIERVPQGWYLPDDLEITSVIILTDLNGFIPDDVEADVDLGIARLEGQVVWLKCKVEYASDKKWSRIALINENCKLLKVA